MEQQTMTAVQAIRKYFFPADAKAADVITEIKQLTDADKRELAEGAAKELGVTISTAS